MINQMAVIAKAAKLTVAVLTYNEERKLAACLETLAIAAEVLVVDSYSNDETVYIAERSGARVIQSDRLGISNPGGYAAQRNYAMEQATCEWVLFVDADERLTPDLAQELVACLSGVGPSSDVDAFRMRRIEHFWGIRSDFSHAAGWQTRLLRRDKCRWNGRLVHEEVDCQGKVESLQGRLLHYSKDSVAEYVTTMNRYTTLEAEQAFADGRPLAKRPWKLMIRNFVEVYWYKKSYREGAFGFGMSMLFAYAAFLSWLKQWEAEVKTRKISSDLPLAWGERWTSALASTLWRIKSPPGAGYDSTDNRK